MGKNNRCACAECKSMYDSNKWIVIGILVFFVFIGTMVALTGAEIERAKEVAETNRIID